MSQLGSDNFDRANGDLGVNWTTGHSDTAPQIAGDEVVAPNGEAVAFYNVTAAPDDGYSEVAVGSVVSTTSDEGVGPAYRLAPAAKTHYFGQTNTHETRLYKVIAGSYTQLGSDGPACATGDLLRLICTGTSISLTKNGTTIVGPVTDSSIASGSAGIRLTPAGGGTLDNFAFGDSGTDAPTLTSIGTANTVHAGDTGVAVAGTNLDAAGGRTFALVQGGVTVTQTETGTGTDTAATLTVVTHNSGTAKDLKHGAVTLTVTRTADSQTASLAGTLDPPTGQLYVDLTSVNATASNRITATPDLAAGDQLQASGGGSAGASAAPTGLTLNADATFQFASGDTPADFDVRAWDASDSTWGAWATQSMAGGVTLTGQSIGSAQGALGPQTALALRGQGLTSVQGALSPSVVVPISGLTVTFAQGVVSASSAGNVTLALVGLAMTATAGDMTSALSVPLDGQSVLAASGAVGPSLTGVLSGLDVAVESGTLGPRIVRGLTGAALLAQSGNVGASFSLALSGQSALVRAGFLIAPVPTLVGDPRYVIHRMVVRTFTAARSIVRTFTVNSMSIRFPVKGPAESVPVTFDFSTDLPSGVTLTGSPTLEFATTEGTDANPSAIQSGAAGFDSSKSQVVVPVTAGIDGCEYTITCTCPTSQDNLTLTLVGILPVRANLN